MPNHQKVLLMCHICVLWDLHDITQASDPECRMYWDWGHITKTEQSHTYGLGACIEEQYLQND